MRKKYAWRGFGLALAVIVAAGVVTFFSLHAQNRSGLLASGIDLSHIFSPSGTAPANTAPEAVSANPSGGVRGDVFSDSSNHFSFTIPNGFSVGYPESKTGTMILVQSQNGKQGIQIYITPFTDPGSSITALRVQSEAGLSISHAAPLTVAAVAHGLIFEDDSSNPPLEAAWFAYHGSLYQVSTWESDAPLLDTLLASWRFTS